MKSRMDSGPLPTQRFAQQVADIALPPLQGCLEGSQTSSSTDQPLGITRFDGSVVGVFATIGGTGKDDDNALSGEFDVMVNGATVLSAEATIAHVSGEGSLHKTSFPEAADVGVTEAVIDPDSAEFVAGDIITWNFNLKRTASPTTEITNPCIIVELRPSSG
jgi:hypothetical protein